MHTMPEMIIAIYPDLKSAQDTMSDLEKLDLPYPTIRLKSHSSNEPDLPPIEETRLPDLFWSLSVVLKEYDPGQILDMLNAHKPLAIGRRAADNKGRDEVDQGAIAWRHYVFVQPDITPGYPETGGNAGTTGTVSTGVFAEGAHAEETPSLPGFTPRPLT